MAGPAAEPRAAAPGVEERPDERAPGGEHRRLAKALAELPVLVLVAFVIAVVIKTFLVQAFWIPSASMMPTLVRGDRVLVEKISYRFGGPERGDVVVFEKSIFGAQPDLPWYRDAGNFLRELLGLPTGLQEDYIKRVVAIGGDTIRYAGKPRRLEINGEVVDEPYIRGGVDRSSATLTKRDCRRLQMRVAGDGCRVPAGMVFVMGDNRPNSEDSRFLGPIDDDKIVGKAFVIIWPPGNLGLL